MFADMEISYNKFNIPSFFFTAVMMIVLMASVLPASGKEDWKVVKKKNGIIVKSRKVPFSPLNEGKAECVINSSIEAVYDIIKDPSTYNNWFAFCAESRVIEKIDENTNIVYQVANLPFPLQDMDSIIVFHTNEMFESDQAIIEINLLPDHQAVKYHMDEITRNNNRMRVKAYYFTFFLDRISPSRTKVVYMAGGDPGAPVPKWVLNMFSSIQSLKSLEGLREEVKKRELMLFNPVNREPRGLLLQDRSG